MQSLAWPLSPASTALKPVVVWALVASVLPAWLTGVHGMTAEEKTDLRRDTEDLFYHGFDNYMRFAFPEDELRPISCRPQTRNPHDPSDIGLNDVLGNYSLTLIDSLSTLAILASEESADHKSSRVRQRKPLADFQDGIKSLVELYGHGTEAQSCGTRACGFDLDSKVQVFETNIRGVGGLLSAHLFAIGELPIAGYSPEYEPWGDESSAIVWDNGMLYNGQLLNLAYDLASRLLPAFGTGTGIPYPRVNLRHGIPFYGEPEDAVCLPDGSSSSASGAPREITENCAAGAGSLILEFSTLSRLTGDMRFENLAKQAFWAIWNRRSQLDLVGNGIDSETGHWTQPSLAGIGAGIDSFFEYALKAHVLLSNLPYDENQATAHDPQSFLQVWQSAHAAVKHHILRGKALEKHPHYSLVDPNTGAPRYTWVDNLSAYYPGLLTLAGEVDEAIESHLLFAALWTRYSALPERWHVSHANIDPNFRHWAGRPEFIESTFYLYQATRDPYYLHVGEMAIRDIRRRCWTKCGWADLADVESGRLRDRMESFFLGETAKYFYLLFTENHPLNKLDGAVVFTTEGHPLTVPRHRANVTITGGRQGHTNRQPASQAFDQEDAKVCPSPPAGVPFSVSNIANRQDLFHAAALVQLHLVPMDPVRPSPIEQASPFGPGVDLKDVYSPTNYTFYPWTLPASLIPSHGMSAPIRTAAISTLTFPNIQTSAGPGANTQGNAAAQALASAGLIPPPGAIQKLVDGFLITSLSNLKLNLIHESRELMLPARHGGGSLEVSEFRIQGVANWALGRDERVLITGEAVKGFLGDKGGGTGEEEHFRRVKDRERVDFVLDVPVIPHVATADGGNTGGTFDDDNGMGRPFEDMYVEHLDDHVLDNIFDGIDVDASWWDDLDSLFTGILSSFRGVEADHSSGKAAHSPTPAPTETHTSKPFVAPITTTTSVVANNTPRPSSISLQRRIVSALLPVGPGAAPLPSAFDAFDLAISSAKGIGHLPIRRIFFLDGTLCDNVLPTFVTKEFEIVIIGRGGCSFSEKLQNVPAIVPTKDKLQAIIVVSPPGYHRESGHSKLNDPDDEQTAAPGDIGPDHVMTRPFLDKTQRTPNGLERRYLIPLILVDGSEEDNGLSTTEAFKKIASQEGTFDEHGNLIQLRDGKHVHTKQAAAGPWKGMAVKRRYWFESLGMVIKNLVMV